MIAQPCANTTQRCFRVFARCCALVLGRPSGPSSTLLVVAIQHGPANMKHITWASLRFLPGRHLQTTLSIGYYYIGFSVECTTEPFFLTQFSQRSPKSEHYVLIGHFLIEHFLIGHFLIGRPIYTVSWGRVLR